MGKYFQKEEIKNSPLRLCAESKNIVLNNNIAKKCTTTKPYPHKKAKTSFATLKKRFEQNMQRHQGLEWAEIQAKLAANPTKLWSLNEMEKTGGEPDVVAHNKETGEYIFYDCAAESPKKPPKSLL